MNRKEVLELVLEEQIKLLDKMTEQKMIVKVKKSLEHRLINIRQNIKDEQEYFEQIEAESFYTF